MARRRRSPGRDSRGRFTKSHGGIAGFPLARSRKRHGFASLKGSLAYGGPAWMYNPRLREQRRRLLEMTKRDRENSK